MNFLLIAFALTLLAMLAILFAVVRKPAAGNPDAGHDDRIRRNLRLYEQRIAELDEDLAEEYISQEDYQRQYADMSRQLLQTVQQLEHAPQAQVARRRWLLWFVPAPLLAFALYAVIGAYPDWKISQQLGVLQHAPSQQMFDAKMADINQAMLDRLDVKPDQLEYRLMVARYAMNQGDYQQATDHYRILAEILPDDADAQAFLAQAEYLKANRKITADVAQALDRALRIDPYQSTALGLVGIHAFESGDLQGALDAWEKLLSVLPPNSDRAQLIRGGIEEARKRLIASGELPAVAEDTPVIASEGIRVKVDLGKDLPEMKPGMTVFVYAKAASGPPMPLAVQKLTLKQLPATIVLDESMAMMPNMSLGSFDQVIVGARISLSGRPVPQAGDWQGESKAINWREEGDVTVTIDEAVK